MIEWKQSRHDPEMAPPLARCPGCGGEIYRLEELWRHGGLCRDCAGQKAEETRAERRRGSAEEARNTARRSQ